MPHAETSRVRRARLKKQLTQRELAELAGLSSSTIGVIERLRNPRYVRELLDSGQVPSRTTVEVVMRIAAALGLMNYNQRYTLDEVARMQKLIARGHITDKASRPCKRPYPGKDSTPTRRTTSTGIPLIVAA